MDIIRNRKNNKIKHKPKVQPEEKYIETLPADNNLDDTLQNSIIEQNNVKSIEPQVWNSKNVCRINCEIDLISVFLFLSGLITRIYKLQEPKNIVFDELHYGKYVSLYMRNTFFFDSHPPLGKQLIAAVAYCANFDGKFKFDKIGNVYGETVPLFALRFIPAFCGSLIIPIVYHIMLESGLSQWTSLLAGLLLLFDNAILTQSRFMLMESILLFFSLFGLLSLLKFRKYYDIPYCVYWWFWLIVATVSLTCALCVKYTGFYTCCLGLVILIRDFWASLSSPKLSDKSLCIRLFIQAFVGITVSTLIYLSIFYVHLNLLCKAGPHDSIMTSAFQASLEGGLASITKGQPLIVGHGSQITLRHTHGRTCWLHSHAHVYPIRYPDKRGSSHQQQVTCYSFKDVNNWWIVKRPDKNDLVVEQPIDAIKHGDIIQLVHGGYNLKQASATFFCSESKLRITKSFWVSDIFILKKYLFSE